MATHRFADKVAVPIVEKTPLAAGLRIRKLDQESRARGAEIQKYEVRFDAFKDGLRKTATFMNLEGFLEIASGLEHKIIGTNTHASEVIPLNSDLGFNGSETDRARYLQILSERVGHVSIEHNHSHPVSGRAARVIAMMHMPATPDVSTLLRLAGVMQVGKTVNVVKFASIGETMQDTLNMLQFAYTMQQRSCLPTIPLVMKEVGRISRVLAPYFGAEITFARRGEGSAPGQIDYYDIFKLFDQVDRLGVPDIMKMEAPDLENYAKEVFKVLES
jgi:3-dehydroquinate dehydratase-1